MASSDPTFQTCSPILRWAQWIGLVTITDVSPLHRSLKCLTDIY